MRKFRTTETYIEDAKKVHGDQFDYSEVVYTKMSENIKVTCNRCGEVFYPEAKAFLRGTKCPHCCKSKFNSVEEIVEALKAKHGDKYDYSKVKFATATDNITLVCKTCGTEFSEPLGDALNGHGCPICSHQHTRRNKFLGVGVNDLSEHICSTEEGARIRRVWANMLRRCYDPEVQKKQPTYIGCTVDKRWFSLAEFKKFYDANYHEGYHIDKDILVRDNKVYSPENCCFVPQEINALLTRRQNERGKYKQGVRHCNNPRNKTKKFIAQINIRGKRVSLGYYETEEEAFIAYKTRKEALIKEIATEYYNNGKIAENVYKALLKYEVRPTD